MREYISTISSDGRVTIPVALRKQLGWTSGDRIAFVLTDEGSVVLRRPQLALEAVVGSVEALPKRITGPRS